MPANYSHTDRAEGSILTAVFYNGDHQKHITFGTPTGLDDHSVDVTQMQSVADPGELSTESLPTSLAGELQRIRFVLAELKGTTYWYQTAKTPVSPYNQEWW